MGEWTPKQHEAAREYARTATRVVSNYIHGALDEVEITKAELKTARNANTALEDELSAYKDGLNAWQERAECVEADTAGEQ